MIHGSVSALPPTILTGYAALYLESEATLVPRLLAQPPLNATATRQASIQAENWIKTIRATPRSWPGANELLRLYGLETEEGLALMCLAEALLRIPDAATADALIADKLADADWNHHWDTAQTNAEHWLLQLARQALATGSQLVQPNPKSIIAGLTQKLGAPLLRQALQAAMKVLAEQFVFGPTIEAGLVRGHSSDGQRRISFDMLGEGARTTAQAERFYQDYLHAIATVGAHNRQSSGRAEHGISVKLSALHPRYESAQALRVEQELLPRLISLAEAAAAQNIFMVIDAEEADRLLLSLGLLAGLLAKAKLGGWRGLGMAVQAYSKAAPWTINTISQLAAEHQRPMLVRLIKGAYWDTEIKRAQERGLSDYPVFSRKATTDLHYLHCAKLLLDQPWLQPVFGSHNALTIASILAMAAPNKKLEFQRLHGMGEELYAQLEAAGHTTCIYAPIGAEDVLLGYLVRRLIENGANSSFVSQLYDPQYPIEKLTIAPATLLAAESSYRHPALPLPTQIFGERRNSSGLDLSLPSTIDNLSNHLATPYRVSVTAATPAQISAACASANAVAATWANRPVRERADCLQRLADLLEQQRPQFINLLCHEAHKTWPDAVAEIREAVDFCRYYAAQALQVLSPKMMPSITGEQNIWQTEGRGIIACISPWNFPLAIYLGQVAAALVAGNVVLAKPAPQTPQIAMLATQLAHAAGVPPAALQLLPGDATIGQLLVAAPEVAGVVFTGSLATARQITQALANKPGLMPPLIAETGGINAMIVDSSALPEQVVDDVITSGFRSAGQRCSALRLLCVPHATADSMLTMLMGAMAELRLGPATDFSTDVGPVIDAAAAARLEQHIVRLQQGARLLYKCPKPQQLGGHFVPPQLWEIPHIDWLTEETFGPIVHVIKYDPAELSALVTAINKKGFGLTAGIHTRVTGRAQTLAAAIQAGNIYVNRSMIGAVVESQPFGGHGLSGTGPKAGGPHYLLRLVREKLISINTTASGGNTSLLLQTS